MKSFVLAVSILCWVSIPLSAQVTAINDEIVVTASALPEKLESTPASITIITKKEIEERAARDLGDVLREVPGITIARSGSPGKQTSLFTRGAAAVQTLVLWNGVKINNPYFAGYDWGRFSTAGVERVEVVRGPYSALYGSDATAGVINILTTPSSSGLFAEVQSGGHGLRNALVNGTWVGTGVQLGGTYEHRQDDGFFANDDFRENTATATARWSATKALSLGLDVRHSTFDLGIPFNNDFTGTLLVPSPDRRQDGHETVVSLPITLTLGRFANELSLSDARRREHFVDPQDPFGLTETDTNSKTRRARLATHFASPIGTLIAGAEYERATVDDVSNFGPNFTDQARTARSFFVSDRWTRATGAASRLELSVGVRYDHFNAFGSQTSPRLAAGWIFGRNKLRAAYGHGFRAPSLGELYYPFFGNPDLTAERSRSYEVGYDRATANDGLFSITWFDSRYKQLITFDPRTFISQNIGRVKTDGVEVGVETPITARFYTTASYTYLHRADNETTGQRLTRRPKHSGSLAVGYRAGAIDGNVVLIRSGERVDTQAVSPFARATNAGYTTVDATLQYRIGKVAPFLKVENLTDAQYEEVLGFPSPGRRAIVGLRLGL
jgi:vitamin B12 transporter